MSGTVHLKDNFRKNSLTNTSFYSSPFKPKKHNHVEIIFDDLKVIYNDPRRFGFFEIIRNKDLLKKRFSHLGPEPFDINFNVNYIFNFFKKKEKTYFTLNSFCKGSGPSLENLSFKIFISLAISKKPNLLGSL